MKKFLLLGFFCLDDSSGIFLKLLFRLLERYEILRTREIPHLWMIGRVPRKGIYLSDPGSIFGSPDTRKELL